MRTQHPARGIKALILSLLASVIVTACNPAGSSLSGGAQWVAPPTAPVARLTPPPQSDGRPSLVPAACAHALPADLVEGDTVLCGHLRVPQDRAWPDDLWLELPYTLIKRSDSSSPELEPLLFLTGGPAGSALANFAEVYAALQPFRAGRDIVLYEPRGLPLATPNLVCPPAARPLDVAAERAKLDARLAEIYRPIPESLVGLPQCADALASQGIDLTHYDSKTNADDAADLMHTLGFARYDLYAVSHGTRVALEMMRAYPQNLHAVVLDSMVPPSVNVYETQPTQARYEVAMLVFDQCAASPACNSSFARLKVRYADLVTRLNKDPIALGLPNHASSSFSGDDLMQFVLTQLTPDNVSLVPLMIHELDLGETRMLKSLLQNPAPAPAAPLSANPTGSIAESVANCRDEWAFTQVQTALTPNRSLNLPAKLVTADLAALRAIGAGCALLPTGKALLRQTEVVKSNIPTLIYQGLLDDVTPPSWAAVARKTLSNHYYFEFPGQPHDILRQPLTLKTGCATRMAIQFFDRPAQQPDGECIQPNYGFAFVIEGRDPSVVARAHGRSANN